MACLLVSVPGHAFFFDEDDKPDVDALGLPFLNQEQQEEALPPIDFTIKLRLINKKTREIKDIELERHIPIHHGSLSMSTQYCFDDYQGVHGRDVAWLDFYNKEGKSLFSGWVYADLPGVSTLTHPVYTVKLLSCTIKKDAS